MPARIAVNTAPLPQPPLMHATWGHDSRTHSAHMACKHAPSKSWGRAADMPLEETRSGHKLKQVQCGTSAVHYHRSSGLRITLFQPTALNFHRCNAST
jgi:hypothetical protein